MDTRDKERSIWGREHGNEAGDSWRHAVVLNQGTFDWPSRAVTQRLIFHRIRDLSGFDHAMKRPTRGESRRTGDRDKR